MDFDMANPTALASVRAALSMPRLAPFDLHAGNDPAGGLQLYEWNIHVGAAFFQTLHTVEVVLRNTLNDQLCAWHTGLGLPGNWFDDPLGLLDRRGREDIAKARRRLRTQGYPITPDRIVTELSFGFWRFLLARRYHVSLWVPTIRHGFPHLQPPTRPAIAEPVTRLHQLRNRIAHHEPIYKRDLAVDLHDARTVLGAISPIALAWADQNSALPGVLGVRPAPVRIPLPRCP